MPVTRASKRHCQSELFNVQDEDRIDQDNDKAPNQRRTRSQVNLVHGECPEIDNKRRRKTRHCTLPVLADDNEEVDQEAESCEDNMSASVSEVVGDNGGGKRGRKKKVPLPEIVVTECTDESKCTRSPSMFEDSQLEGTKNQPDSEMKREGTYIIDSNESALEKSTANKSVVRNIFRPASPCALFKSKTSEVKKAPTTPVQMICRSISVGSAGKTPMPPPKKSSPVEKPTGNATPKAGGSNLLRSVNAKENNPRSRQLPFANFNLDRNTLKTSVVNNKVTKIIPKGRVPVKASNIKKISKGISKLPRKNNFAISEAKTKQILKVLQNDVLSTPDKLIKPTAPISKSKMPNFASLHKKQFDRMESLVQNKIRIGERAKKLLSYNQTKPNDTEKSTAESDIRPLPGFTRFGFKLDSDAQKTFLPNVTYTNSPVSKSIIMTKVKEQTKGCTPKSVAKKKTAIETHDYIVGVRTNRQFELRMRARKVV